MINRECLNDLEIIINSEILHGAELLDGKGGDDSFEYLDFNQQSLE
ncbi:hypothetical protein GCM10007063_17990 [Lentibacillus kapialis]|uniref:Uncharacterized protein n=1 Tax=Lentibacillus kapialis TaxID=340214 RepID=A0A917PWU4_9BACI|nr:hypothetical protein GCM10007063_17990 [Lentibacillus kapialis]